MARRKFNKRYGWNNQFKNKPIRSDRWDPFPKDHLPFIDDYGVQNFIYSHVANPGIKRKFDDLNTPQEIRKRSRVKADLFTPDDVSDLRPSKAGRRPMFGTSTRSLFTNENVANAGTAAVIGGRMVQVGAGMARDALNRRVSQGIEDGFASHYRYIYGRAPRAGEAFGGVPGQGTFTGRTGAMAAEADGTAGVDILTSRAITGGYMTEMIEGLGRMLPMIEELLPLAALV